MLYKYLTTMKKILLSLLILNSISCFSQENFTKTEFDNATHYGEKWNKDIKLFLYGNYTKENYETVVSTIKEFNSLMESIKITIVDNIDASNSVIYFISDDEFIKLFDWSSKDVKNSTGITYITHGGKNISKCRTHIDIIECGKYKCTPITIRHEMFHILGFCHQENEKNTILKSKSIVITERDKEMISLLYKK